MRTSPLSRMLPVAVTIGLVISLPNLLSAGHVESRILLETSPLAWWEKNKTRVMEALSPKGENKDDAKKDEKKILEELGKEVMDNLNNTPMLKFGYPALLYTRLTSAGEKVPAEVRGAMKTIENNYRNMTSSLDWQKAREMKADAFLREVHSGLVKGTSSKVQKAFRDFVHSVDTLKYLQENQKKQLSGGAIYESPEFAIIDVIMLLEFLDPRNEEFFKYYYSNDAIMKNTPNRYKIDFRPEVIAQMRKELKQILAEMGPAAVPHINRVLEELKTSSANDGKTVVLPQTSTAVEYHWSTKATTFPTIVTPSFKKEMEEILTKHEKPRDIETGTPARGNQKNMQ